MSRTARISNFLFGPQGLELSELQSMYVYLYVVSESNFISLRLSQNMYIQVSL